MDQPATAPRAAADGRLLYLAEHLAELHDAADLPWLTGRFEFLGEKAAGASLTVLAVPDERGAFRAVKSSAPRTAVARDVWTALEIDALSSNPQAAEAFTRAEQRGRPTSVRLQDVFPSGKPFAGAENALIAPLLHNRELLGIGVFVVEDDDLTESVVAILATHAAVAVHQLRQREEARRLHSVDALLWVPDELFLLAQFRREVNRARRYHRDVGLALLRVENEPEIRSRFGGFFTDHLLRRIGSQLLGSVRDSDVLGALDGGFGVIHCETSLDGTRLSAGRLRDGAVATVAHRFPESPAPQVSVHAVAFPASGSTADELVASLIGRLAS